MISIIVAAAQNGVIGKNNELPWHIPEDLKRFKAITTGHPVIMGRRTFESLGRPLPNRTNVVITRNRDYRADGVLVAGSLREAVALFPADEEVFIIGGGEIYRQAMEFADKIYLTLVRHPFEGDCYFPAIDESIWRVTLCQIHSQGEKFPYPFEFINYDRV